MQPTLNAVNVDTLADVEHFDVRALVRSDRLVNGRLVTDTPPVVGDSTVRVPACIVWGRELDTANVGRDNVVLVAEGF
jgi:hypothetical protein